MRLLDLLKGVQDVVVYRDEKVGGQDLNYILEAVRFTASAANTQPWEVYIIDSPEIKKALDGCILDPMLREKEDDNRVSAAPLVLVVSMDRKMARARFGVTGENTYALEDIAAAVNNMRLAAAELGIGSCWIREVDMERIAEVLKLPRAIKPAAMVIMGYSGTQGELPPLLKVSDWVHKL